MANGNDFRQALIDNLSKGLGSTLSGQAKAISPALGIADFLSDLAFGPAKTQRAKANVGAKVKTTSREAGRQVKTAAQATDFNEEGAIGFLSNLLRSAAVQPNVAGGEAPQQPGTGINTGNIGVNEQEVEKIIAKNRKANAQQAVAEIGPAQALQNARQLDRQELLNNLLTSIGAGLTTAGGGDASGILGLAKSRIGTDSDFDLKNLAGQALLTGQNLPGFTHEQTLKAADALPPREPKVTKADVDLLTEAALAQQDPGFLGGLLNFLPGGREREARRTVLQEQFGTQGRVKRSLQQAQDVADTVMIRSASGTVGRIPRANLQTALDRGAQLV